MNNNDVKAAVNQAVELQKMLKEKAQDKSLTFNDGIVELRKFAVDLVETNRAVLLALIQKECSAEELREIVSTLLIQAKILSQLGQQPDENEINLNDLHDWLSRVLVVFADAEYIQLSSSDSNQSNAIQQSSTFLQTVLSEKSQIMSCIGRCL